MTDHSKQTTKSFSFNLSKLKEEVYEELTQDILPFWSEKMKDSEHGGYFGQMTGKNQLIKNAPRGGILNARILWTFSSAALHLKNETYLKEAEHAKEYIFTHFFDEKFGGTYWMLNADGSPADSKKQIYCQAFFIYALVEYYRASGNEEALEKAKELFSLIEKYSFDKDKNGYFEAYSRDWVLLDDVRLSDKDANEKKTMNTHLHLLEAYTNLYRVWKNPLLEMQLKNLIALFLNKIINSETFHLNLFFDENWACKSSIQSFGHDIEASWLLDEAATVLGNAETLQKVRNVILCVADAAAEGLRKDGGLMNEKNVSTNHFDTNSDWWPQAEAVVGFFNAYQLSKNESYLEKAIHSWNFIKENLIDKENGEWYWSVSKDGQKDTLNDKAGFWKCPYHNSRMCLEMISRIKEQLQFKMLPKMMKYRKQILTLIFSFFLMGCFAAPKNSPVALNGQLKVSGTQLCNEKGKPVVLRGVSLGWHNLWPRFYNKKAVKWLAGDWQCSVIRAAMGVEIEDNYRENPKFALQCITPVIEGAIENGIYVIIDFHAHHKYLEEAKSFFREMSSKYGKYPNVIYEIWNEPDYFEWPEVKSYAEEVIGVIRAIDPDNIILVGNPHWDQDLHLVAEDPIQDATNIMYTMHFYAATHEKWLRDRTDAAITKGIPVFVSECGASEANGDGRLGTEEWKTYVEWMRNRKLSWVAWSISDKNETCSMLLPRASSYGKWDENLLKPWGKLARQSIIDNNYKKQ